MLNKEDLNISQYGKKLMQMSIFETIKNNKESMTRVMNICNLRKFKKDEALITEGNLGDELFILLEGSVDILKTTASGDFYVVTSLEDKFNVFFGEMALIDDDKRSATVTANEDCLTMVINKSDFLELGNNHPEIGLPITRAIAKIVAGRLRKTNEDTMRLFDALVTEVQA